MSEDEVGNPALIHPGLHRGRPLVPLVLVHDGGGTTFSYHCLEPTNRPLYGIANPRFDEGGYWEGGIPEMAAHYIGLIAKILPAGGDIILGGWSMGGVLSLEISHQLALAGPDAQHPRFRVRGMVWVDSICPRPPPSLANQFAAVALPRREGPVVKTAEELKAMKPKEKADLNMVHARMASGKWVLPAWGRGRGSSSSSNGESDEGGGDAAGEKKMMTMMPPPTILLRAEDPVEQDGQRFVDYARMELLLGWKEYHEEKGRFIQSVVPIEGHHFNIFDWLNEERLKRITKKIEEAANQFDMP